MISPPPRLVTLVLCLPDGRLLGALPPLRVEVPWWQEVGPVVEAARASYGVEVTVLRLLHGTRHDARGGPVTYLAEVGTPVGGLVPWTGSVPEHPLRLPYAQPGGPAAAVAWADAALERLGRPRTAAARQVRSWNLSTLWRLPTADSAAWLKVVPPFFAHEGQVVAHLDPAVVPCLLATDGPRLLLDEIPGTDLYEAAGPVLARMVSLLVGLQTQWLGRVSDLLHLGVADFRAARLTELATETLARTADQLDDDTVRACQGVIDGLPERFAALAACGVPDTLVHGDFHPGNVMGGEDRLVLLDWGDCGVGNPLLDRAAFLDRVPDAERLDLLACWDALWRTAVPGSDPARAGQLVEAVSALRQAVVYDTFLASIEPSERVYHATDSARWLRRLAELEPSR